MYRIRIKKKAQKQLSALSLPIADRIAVAINNLAGTLRQVGVKKLQGYSNVYRIRISNYRVIYTIEDDILTVEIIKIGNRKDVYENL
jgi:mRNA interferase RelE/StbE